MNWNQSFSPGPLAFFCLIAFVVWSSPYSPENVHKSRVGISVGFHWYQHYRYWFLITNISANILLHTLSSVTPSGQYRFCWCILYRPICFIGRYRNAIPAEKKALHKNNHPLKCLCQVDPKIKELYLFCLSLPRDTRSFLMKKKQEMR